MSELDKLMAAVGEQALSAIPQMVASQMASTQASEMASLGELVDRLTANPVLYGDPRVREIVENSLDEIHEISHDRAVVREEMEALRKVTSRAGAESAPDKAREVRDWARALHGDEQILEAAENGYRLIQNKLSGVYTIRCFNCGDYPGGGADIEFARAIFDRCAKAVEHSNESGHPCSPQQS